MSVPDANLSNLFTNFAYQASPTGSLEFFGIIILLIFIYLCWGFGLTLISTVILGFVLLGILNMMFGGIFTTLFIMAIAMIGILMGLTFFSRIARGS